MPKILDGRVVANLIAANLAQKINKLKTKPQLAIIQVGDLPASNVYIQRKIRFADQIGARVQYLRFSNNVSQVKLIAEIGKLNRNKKIHGIIVQLPLPARLTEKKHEIINTIALEKDVDGLRPGSSFTPATARGVITLLDFYQIKLAGQKALVIGRSNLVGLPIALALLARNATVTICHRGTKNLAQEAKQADILVVAAGAPKLIKKNAVKRGQVIIDVGITTLEDGKLVGDVDQADVSAIVRSISPVHGGVGPLTVASLFQNLMGAQRLLTENV